MSDYSYDRAVLLGLMGHLALTEKEEFKSVVQEELGLAPGQDCDTICGAMSEVEFRAFVEHVREVLRSRKRRVLEVQQIYA